MWMYVWLYVYMYVCIYLVAREIFEISSVFNIISGNNANIYTMLLHVAPKPGLH